MVTGAIKNKVDKIWTDIWAGGITNPLTVIEQLTYLMFIRSLDEKELATEDFENMAGEKMEHIFPASEAGQSMRWSRFKDKDSREIFLTMQQRVFPAIKKMKYGRLPDFDANGELVEIADDPTRPDEGNTAFARYMDDAMFLIPTPQVLQKIITGLEDLYTHDIADLDMQGDLYEYMLGKLATAGRNGQFRTPKHIRDMMVELVQPTPDDFICDPACGTAGFLVSSAQYLRAHYEDSMTPEQWQHFAGPMFTGFDMDRTMLRISAMNLMLHSITNPEIDYKDSVSKQNSICSKYTICLANPPFKGTVDAESINDDLKAVTNTKKTELLFLALFLRMLKTGGRCACIVPDGVLFGSSKAHQSIRKELIENHQLRAVISMPSGVFKPYAGVSTAVLVFTKTGAGGTDKVWFYDMKVDGFSLDDKRTEVKENDIPDIIARFHNLDAETDRKRTEQSFFVPKEEIAANGYDLSINKYKETEYVPVEYPSTTEILADLHELEMEMFGESEYPRNSLISLIIEGAGLSYGIVQPGDDGTGDMGVLRPVDFADGKIKTDSIKYIDRSLGDGFKKTELNGNELLITVRGTTGITALTDSRFKGMNVTRGIAVIRYDKKKVDSIYLNEYIKMEKSQQYIKEHTRGATLQQINLSELRDLEIVIPPLPLQRVFATFVEHVDQQKQTVQQSLEKLELLKKALMQEYFG